MLRIIALTHDNKLHRDITLNDLSFAKYKWYWVDFEKPTESESELLSSFFHFHPLAIEDCLLYIQRPKLDHYEDYTFFVFHALNPDTSVVKEIDCFLGQNFIVTFHFESLIYLDKIYKKIESGNLPTPLRIFHSILDEAVDLYFPIIYAMEDRLNDAEENTKGLTTTALMDEVFDIRSDLLRLRRTIYPMRDLVYRILNSSRITGIQEYHGYFSDIYDHLLRLSEIVEDSRELTADIRDSYISLNAFHGNQIVIKLTLLSAIFLPLTFIVGVYGMNFDNMPELKWKYGYIIVWIIMLIIGIGLPLWFKKKGWFNDKI
ncbi:magnesium/cobalt transporter CorA [Bacillus sp. FJAT-49736]|uniref:magnesium/cobalt transporter CorA n=1 Tax=Bacillus sp. FJAT-49736 TaxID=2833582 RepID=UPI001BC9041A|nr:magnesium/cobalt transporter CorA [Bacillus sp. FJAT-49736]MBS4171850.1 magnesium/cobalt transporter CorA [Bacillus sp. FJAT-49736]